MISFEISVKKRRLTADLLSVRNRMITIAYTHVGSDKTLQELAKALSKVELKNYPKASQKMREQVLFYAKKCKATLPKKTEKEDQDIMFPLVSRFFERNHVGQVIKQKVVYPTAQKFEENEKKAYIKTIIDTQFETGENAIFFLCSEHGDCAEDHLAYQGKLYVDRHWRKKVAKKEDKDKIQAFISMNQIKRMQWVIFRPVWMITRPNCRHYFQPLTAEEAMSESVSVLIAKYDMYHDVGQRGAFQSIEHPINKGWYTKSNVKSILNQYLDRLRMHKEMYEAHPNQELASQIRKDRLLVERWRRYYKINF